MSDQGVIAEAKRTQVSGPDEAIGRLAVSPLHRLSVGSIPDQHLAFS